MDINIYNYKNDMAFRKVQHFTNEIKRNYYFYSIAKYCDDNSDGY